MPTLSTPLTDADTRALAKMPKGWFHPDALPFVVKNAKARCQRLEQMGKLESRVVGPDLLHLTTEFRLKP